MYYVCGIGWNCSEFIPQEGWLVHFLVKSLDNSVSAVLDIFTVSEGIWADNTHINSIHLVDMDTGVDNWCNLIIFGQLAEQNYIYGGIGKSGRFEASVFSDRLSLLMNYVDIFSCCRVSSDTVTPNEELLACCCWMDARYLGYRIENNFLFLKVSYGPWIRLNIFTDAYSLNLILTKMKMFG